MQGAPALALRSDDSNDERRPCRKTRLTCPTRPVSRRSPASASPPPTSPRSSTSTPKTSGRCFAKELASGQVKANARVAESLYRKATGEGREAVTAAIFWLKTRAHWKETSAHEHSGAFVHEVRSDGEPVRQKIERMIERLRLAQEVGAAETDGE